MEGSASAMIVAAYKEGWKHVMSFDWRGQRFCGAGLGEHSEGFRIDVFGTPAIIWVRGLMAPKSTSTPQPKTKLPRS